MRASIRDIVVAIASGTIVYPLVHTIADEGEAGPYYTSVRWNDCTDLEGC
jgi:hypothetical protein